MKGASSFRLLFAMLTMMSLSYASCVVNRSDENLLYYELEEYYNSIIPIAFPRLELMDSQRSIVVWNAPGTPSYLINADSIYSDPDNDRSQIKLELLSDKRPQTFKFISSDSMVGYPFVNNGINSQTGKEYHQMNIYGPEFYLTTPENSELDYLPVIMHELAHMTEKSTKDEQMRSKDMEIGPFPLVLYFEEDSNFRKQVINENKFLLEAIEAPKEEVNDFLIKYIEAKEIRKKESPDSLMNIEPSVEASEGYGRYVEYLCKIGLDSKTLNDLFDFNIKVPKYKLSDEPWMSDASIGNSYMYATGFNKIRILVKYKNTAFLDIYKGLAPNNLDPYIEAIIKDHSK